MMQSPGWFLITAGLILVVVGLIWVAGGNFSWIGRLPGDIRIEGENGRFYFPVTTCLLLSLVLSLLMGLVRWFSNR